MRSLLLCLLGGGLLGGEAKRRGGLAPPGVSLGAFELAAHVLAPDIFSHMPRSFEPSYKASTRLRASPGKGAALLTAAYLQTPCWHVDGALQCLPYYYVLGGFQSGTLDLHERMLRHPNIAVRRSCGA